jgi:DNA polymerase elongation subunit (family B)
MKVFDPKLPVPEIDYKEIKPKIAFWDVENSPLIAATWNRYEADAVWVEQESYLLSWSFKWLDGKQITKALPDYPNFDKDQRDDSALVKELAELLEKADIIVAHNGDRFDIRKAQARMLMNGFDPPKPFKTVDTLKVAKKHFMLSSNKLDHLGQFLNVGRKVQTGGYELWKKCMEGDKRAWNRMKRYNAQDVRLLEAVYLKLRPWHDTHPNMNVIMEREDGCPKCGGKELTKRGYAYTRTGRSSRFQCLSCKGYSCGPHKKIARTK